MPRGRKRRAETAPDGPDDEAPIEAASSPKHVPAKVRRTTRKRPTQSANEATDTASETIVAENAGKGRKRQRNSAIKVEEADDDNNKSSATKHIPKRKVAAQKPSLVKAEPESATAALRRIAQVVHSEDDASDTSSDEESLAKPTPKLSSEGDSGAEDDDDALFEDVDLNTKPGASSKFDQEEGEDTNKEELNLTLEKAERLQLTKTGKKKQSARAVHERAFAHYMSTIAMVALGAWRNAWINDVRLHKILRKHMRKHAARLDKDLTTLAQAKNPITNEFIEILGRVMNHFHSRFKRTKQGLRKLGHRPVSQMDAAADFERTAESFADKEDFVSQAKKLEGSRDFGAQLFTALLRAYHFKARLIFSTQPLGFKFNEREEYNPAIVKEAITAAAKRATTAQDDKDSSAQPKESEDLDDKSKSKSRGTRDDAISLSDSELSSLGSEYDIDPDRLSDAAEEFDANIKVKLARDDRPDHELEYPIFWSEVYDQSQSRWVAIDAMVKKAILVDEKGFKSLHPRGTKAERQKLTLGFVVAYDANMYAKDVTVRYASSWAKVKEVFLRADGKTNTRYDVNKILVRLGNSYRDEDERREDDLLAFKEVKRPPPDEMPKSLADFKNSPKYILDKHLREKSAFKPGAKPVDTFTVGKGSKETTSLVYLRDDVVPAKTIENYHKEGRRIKDGERPIKMIKARAVTTARLREHAAIMEETGASHVMQGIYSIDQTEYIIPPPIENGIIPKNAFGNADVFVESMVPQGATHLKLKGAAKIARKLDIEHAEAVVGFEFKKRGAIPVVLGVLVPDEDAERLEAAWHEAEELRIRKEDKKRTDAALKLWMKLLKGMRIRQRINTEYGIPKETEAEDDGAMFVPEPEKRRALPGVNTVHEGMKQEKEKAEEEDDDDTVREEGGFLREDEEHFLKG